MSPTPSEPVTADLTRDELLVLLIEECAEVVQAATKCLRFGWDRQEPGYGANDMKLAEEVGDMMGVAEALPLNHSVIGSARLTKITRAKLAKAVREARP